MSTLSAQQAEDLRRLVSRTALEDPLGKTIDGITAKNVTPAIEEVLQLALATSTKIAEMDAATAAAAAAAGDDGLPIRGDEGLTYPLSFSYGAGGLLDKISDALLESVVFLYDSDGLLTTITHSKDETVTTVTWANGQITTIAQAPI